MLDKVNKLPGIRAIPLNTASCTALIPIPSTVLPSSRLSDAVLHVFGGLWHGKLPDLNGTFAIGRAFG